MGAKEEFRAFCKYTSAGGIPRVAWNRSVGFRVYWVIIIVAVYALFICDLCDKVIHYLAYSTETTTHEIWNESVGLPVITVCDRLPFPASRAEDTVGVTNYTAYLALVQQTTACAACAEKEAEAMTQIRYELMGPRGYLQYLSEAETAKVARNATTVLDCSVTFTQGTQERRTPCSDLMKVTPRQTPDHGICYEYSMIEYAGVQFQRLSLELVVYLDRTTPDVSSTPTTPFNPYVSTGSGVRVLFRDGGDHDSGSDPAYVDVSPGVVADVTLAASETRRLGPPFGQCEDRREDDDDNDDDGDEDMENASCLRDVVAGKCNCTLYGTGGPDKEGRLAGKPYCDDLHAGIQRVKDNRQCIDAILLADDSVCRARMEAPPCEETRYTPTMDAGVWPEAREQPSFMEYAKVMPGYPHGDATDGLDDSQLSRFVASNFLKLRISHPRPVVLVSEQRAAYTLSRLLESIALMLCIFCGISLFFFFEVFECLFKMCCGSKTGSKCDTSDHGSGNEAYKVDE